MEIAFGFKSHSGWAALVVMGIARGKFQIVDRRRVELFESDRIWAKAPYHAAEELEPARATDLVAEGISLARSISAREMKKLVRQYNQDGDEIAACAVLMPRPMPEWTTAEIISVHFRMHKAEGVLFPDALCRAARGCGLRLVEVSEKTIGAEAERVLGPDFADTIRVLGKSAGPPWAIDQRTAALAAMIALKQT